MKHSYKAIHDYIDEKLLDIKNKIVIVTGANSGLGFSICRIALIKGAKVVMAVRNASRGNKAKEMLKLEFPFSEIDLLTLDQSKQESITKFVYNIENKYPNFYALVLNAGILNSEKGAVLENGLPIIAGTNSFGPLQILDQLSPYLMKADNEKRIILQGSLVTYLAHFKNINCSLNNSKLPMLSQYNNSKFAVSNIFDYYAKNNKNPFVKFLLCEPGISKTNIVRQDKMKLKKLFNSLTNLLFQPSIQGSLPAAITLCNFVNNGDYYKPNGLFSISGFPKKTNLKKRVIKDNLVDEMRKLINE